MALTSVRNTHDHRLFRSFKHLSSASLEYPRALFLGRSRQNMHDIEQFCCSLLLESQNKVKVYICPVNSDILPSRNLHCLFPCGGFPPQNHKCESFRIVLCTFEMRTITQVVIIGLGMMNLRM